MTPQLPTYPSDFARYDAPSRRQKGAKIRAILRDYRSGGRNLGLCLDVACGPGLISDELAKEFEHVVGLDLDRGALAYGRGHKTRSNLELLTANAGCLPVPSAAFDVVICAQVYEHVPNPELLAAEIWRVLKPGGICFFSGPNRLALLEEHYFLPLLSWLPRPLADAYVRLSGRGRTYDASPRYLWQIQHLWRRFERFDYSLELVARPQDFRMGAGVARWSWLAQLPAFVQAVLLLLWPNYNWILVKIPRDGEL
jgi:SAM-dependent methyltransferase